MALNIELLESSFSQIRTQETECMNYFYTTLFADYPQVKLLFANTAMRKQAKQLFKSLVFVVENLRCPDVLATALKALGTRHVQYGVQAEHYPIVGSTLLKAFSICLDSAWTPDTEQSWSKAYAVITELMLSGTEYPNEILTLQKDAAQTVLRDLNDPCLKPVL